jgi:hypothetical protein
MAVTHTVAISREQCFQQIDKLIKSHSLHGSESLCKLLRYLAEHSLDHPGTALKEYQIATEVLGRPAGFDPQSDSTVRVQAGRLRVKLAEYYANEGPDDPIVVEIPKGSYALTFHLRPPKPGTQSATTLAFEPGVKKKEEQSPSIRGWAIAVVVLSVLLAATFSTTAYLLSQRVRTQAVASPPVPAPYQIFWNRFVTSPQQPWVIFSNASFVGHPNTNMHYFNAASDPRGVILDHYTGVGEVLAVHQLDRVFTLFNRQIRVKRGALFSLDDAKNNDLIFIGSPAENLTLLEIPGTQQFVFRKAPAPRDGDVEVVNLQPDPGESKTYIASPSNQPIAEDYAVIGLEPGIDPVRSTLILAGTTTMGTQAAAEYVSREDSLAELLSRLGVSKATDLMPFEALLRVKVSHGVPVKTDLLAIRKRGNSPSN